MREQKDWEIYTHSHNNVMMGFFWDLTKPSAELDLSITSTTIYLIRSTSKANIGLILYIMKTILPMTILVYLLLSQDYIGLTKLVWRVYTSKVYYYSLQT